MHNSHFCGTVPALGWFIRHTWHSQTSSYSEVKIVSIESSLKNVSGAPRDTACQSLVRMAK
ncbi:hypothetical protein E2C01_035803 [Portunus trituberculatus]|uniref:Uncharacterized protein n=1 Tax=Portunus trituberculatus TaxID=210409 RepID=A0A5B7FAB2_PORTR|nr:hypothetical protein [Portunus trituberculatus]